MIKISEEQAVKMAHATITRDESEEKIKQIVSEILHAWKWYGYIEGYDRMDSGVSEERSKCSKCGQVWNDTVTGEYPCQSCRMPTVHDA